MAKINSATLRAEMLVNVQSIERYLKNVKKYIRTAETNKISINCIVIGIELRSIQNKNAQLAVGKGL